ncbi:MAG: hypothetical protein U5Q03_03205 [Bacteroidota bacterium]|nr:hypothetical protein [Bacteroidota bacterium]
MNVPVPKSMVFDKKSDLIREARKRIQEYPDWYTDYIYGEKEAGGTGFMYNAPVPFRELDFKMNLEKKPYPELTKGFLYSVPILFFVSSIFAGLSMVIFEGSVSQRVFSDQISEQNHKKHRSILHSLSKICAVSMFAYFFLQIITFVHGQHWDLINTPLGYWYLTEMIGFVLLPMLLFIISYRKVKVKLIRIASLITMLGIIINRLNLTVIGFRWDIANHYYPSWMEIVVTLAVIFTEIWIFRWVIRRMPVLRDAPGWANKES